MTTPRVLQCVLSLNPGGTERLVVELTRRLHERLPMAVCCLDDAGAWASQLSSVGIPIHALGRPAGFVPRLGFAIAQLARTHRATVVHCHHYSPFIYGALARCWHPSLRLVYTEHGRLSDAPPSARRRLANLVFARTPHEVFAVSEDLRQHMVAEGFSEHASSVIYNGIDLGPSPGAGERIGVRHRLEVGDDTLVIATIGRLDPVKDLGTLIKALGLLQQQRPALLLIIGDGPERETLHREVVTAGVADRVRFLGHRDDAREWLAGCDVYVNSSISEGVSLTILEAMAAGLPVIATRVGGTPEVVDDAVGVLVPSRSPRALADALAVMERDQAQRFAMGRAARQRVAERFTLDRMVAEYLQVYERLG